jgi:hypothetical protein
VGKSDVNRQEEFVKKHEELQAEGLSIPNIRLAIIKDKHMGIKDLHSYRARLHSLRHKVAFASRLEPFRMATNNRKEKEELVEVTA